MTQRQCSSGLAVGPYRLTIHILIQRRILVSIDESYVALAMCNTHLYTGISGSSLLYIDICIYTIITDAHMCTHIPTLFCGDAPEYN